MAKAGFSHHTVVEWDANAVDTLRRNQADEVWPACDWRIYGGDVHEFDFRELRDEV